MLRVITTQMFQGPFLLTDVRAHVGKRKPVVFGGDDSVFAVGVLFSLGKKVTSQKHQHINIFRCFSNAFRRLNQISELLRTTELKEALADRPVDSL